MPNYRFIDKVSAAANLTANTVVVGDDGAKGVKTQAGTFCPDYNEADQGLTGGGKSAKAYIDAIGADSATIVFRHSSGAATTTYTFSTDETIPSNINVVIEKGALLYRSSVAPSAVAFTGAGLNDATSGGLYTGLSAKSYRVEIDATGTPDTFKWSNDAGVTWKATGVGITGAAQTLEEGVTITFNATTGHTVTDRWNFTVDPIELTINGSFSAGLYQAFSGAGTVIGLRTVYPEWWGAKADCNIYDGTGTATDNTDAFNKVLGSASETNPIDLVLSGGYAVTTLVIPTTGYITIRGSGNITGFYCKDGTDGDFLHSEGHVWKPVAPEAIAGYNVFFKNFFVNVNRPGNSTTGNLRGLANNSLWYTGFSIHAIQNLTFENIYIYDSPTFGTNLYGCHRVRIIGGQVESPLRSLNTDGHHLNGGMRDVIIDGVRFATGDDAIAINVDEGDLEPGDRFIISNIILDNCAGGFRIYGQDVVTNHILISNITGTIGSSHFIIFGQTNVVAGVFEANLSVTVSNVDVKTTQAGQSAIYILASIGSLFLNNVQINSPTHTVSMIYMTNAYTTNMKVSNLVINDCQIYRSDAGNFATYLLYNSGVPIQNLSINNMKVISQKAATYGAINQLLYFTGATAVIAQMNYRGLDLNDVTSIYTLAAGATITKITTGICTRYFTRDTAAADGTVSYTGFGFRPSKVHLIAVTASTLETSDGFDDGTNHYCRTLHTTSNWTTDMTHSIVLYQTAAIYVVGTVTMLQDGISITWVKTGAKVGIAIILCMGYE